MSIENIETRFTEQDERSVEEMLVEYEKQKEEIEKERLLELQELTEEQAEMVADNQRAEEFFSEMRVALDFTRNATAYRPNGRNNYELVSLFPATEDKTAPDGFEPSDYSHCMVLLTNGFDDRMTDLLYPKGNKVHTESYMNQTMYEQYTLFPLKDYNIARSVEQEKAILNEQSVSDIVAVIDYTNEAMEQHNIPKNNVIEATVGALSVEHLEGQAYQYATVNMEAPAYYVSVERAKDLYERGYRADDREKFDNIMNETNGAMAAYAIFLDKFEQYGISNESVKEACDEVVKQDIPVEIVESIDGYVMSATKITPENQKSFDSLVEKGNEVIHTEVPMYTTTDISEVGGKVKLEVADDIGTVEKAQGVLSYEDKEAIADAKEAEHEKKEFERAEKAENNKADKVEKTENEKPAKKKAVVDFDK